MFTAPALSVWNHTSPYQEIVSRLECLIPTSGTVDHPYQNPALERFRKAANCYYDLYNNGLCNRASAFTKMFNAAKYDALDKYTVGQRTRATVEARFEKIIMMAALEQDIITVDSYSFTE